MRGKSVRGGMQFAAAFIVGALIAAIVVLPGISDRVLIRTRASEPTPSPLAVPSLLASPVAPFVIGGLDAPPTAVPEPTALPTATPIPPTATAAPTATAIPATPTPSGPTPTPDRGAPGTAAPVYGAITVPVLMYHYIRVNPNRNDSTGFGLSVTPDDFAQQMQWLVENGYHTVFPGDLRRAIVEGAPLPTKPIVLTFDDGYRDFYTAAWPVLQRLGLKSSVAVITAYADKGDRGDELYLSWWMIRELDRTGMVEIASHTVYHADLTRATAAQRMNELTQSRATLEEQLGHPCLAFVYPTGAFNAAVAADAGRAGYGIAFTTQTGKVRAPADGYRLLTLPRLRVSGGQTLQSFARELG